MTKATRGDVDKEKSEVKKWWTDAGNEDSDRDRMADGRMADGRMADGRTRFVGG